MVSSVSNGAAPVKNYPENANNGPAPNAAASPSSSGNGDGKISYGNYNGPSAQKAPDKADGSDNAGKLKEMDGMLNRLSEMLGGKGGADKPQKDPTTGGEGKDKLDKKEGADKKEGTEKKEGADKKEGTEKKEGADKKEGTEKKEGADKKDKPDIDDKLNKKDKGTDGADDKSSKGLKDKALDILKKMSDVLASIFGPSTSSAP